MQSERRKRWRLRVASAFTALAVLGVAWWWFASSDAAVSNVAATKPGAPTPAITPPSVPADAERSEQPDTRLTATTTATSAALDGEPVHSSFFGRAVDADTGAPVIDAAIALVENQNFEHFPALPTDRLFVKSDANGSFELRFPPIAQAEVWVSASGFAQTWFAFEDAHAWPKSAYVVRLHATVEVEVHARHAVDGPLVNATVRAWTNEYEHVQPDGPFRSGENAEWNASTDAAGVAQLADLPTAVRLHISLTPIDSTDATQFDDIVLARGEKRVVELVLGSGAHISGVLLDQTEGPVKQQEIWLTSHTNMADATHDRCFFSRNDGEQARAKVATDDNGHFDIDDVPVGTWWIGPAMNGGESTRLDERAVCPLATRIDVTNSSPIALALRTQRGLYITAIVLGVDGRPTQASATAWGVDVAGYVHCNPNGGDRIVLGPLLPGFHRVIANGVGTAIDSEAVVVGAGARDVVLRLRAGCTIRGTVVETDASVPVDCPLLAVESGTKGWRGASTRNGAFDIQGIAPGTYDINAATDDGRFGCIRGIVLAVGAPPTPIEIPLRAGARLRIRHDGPQEHAYYYVFDGASLVAAGVVLVRATAVHTVPPGRLRIEMKTDETHLQTREVDISVGEERTVAFKFD